MDMKKPPEDRRSARFTEPMPLAAGSGVDLGLERKPGEPGFMEELAKKGGFTFTDLTKKD
jgi:hypothetical protein